MNKLNYLSVRGQGHSLIFAKGHLVFKVKSCFSKKSVGLFETKYYVKGYGSTRMKIYAHLGHMVTMVATPIYGKNHSKNLLRNQWADCSET